MCDQRSASTSNMQGPRPLLYAYWLEYDVFITRRTGSGRRTDEEINFASRARAESINM